MTDRNERILSVSQVNGHISRLIDGDYVLKRICLRGEISNCKYHSSGHIYFSMKDSSSQIRCAMFARDRGRGLNFRLEDGQSVIARGRVSAYEKGGYYSFIAGQIELEGRGDLYIRYEQLKKDLYRKGYFDEGRKKALPPYPEKVGIVTASTGAAIQDIVSTVRRKNPYVQLYLYPAKVQGEGAASSVAAGIRFLDRFGTDIIIIGRGGGSIEDLWAFNEIEVADAIYHADTPIISGTGHETDTTIADYCADVRAATPTAAANLAVPDREMILAAADNMQYVMEDLIQRKIQMLRGKHDLLSGHLEKFRPEHRILTRRIQTDHLREKLNGLMQKKLEEGYKMCGLYHEKLSLLSPVSRLKGGYTFAGTMEGNPLRSVRQLEQGQHFQLIFSDGQAEVRTIRLDYGPEWQVFTEKE